MAHATVSIAHFHDALVMNPRGYSIDEIAETIFCYVVSCPNACDTVDGIQNWWIPRQRLIEARKDVLAALQRLKASGRIEERVGADGTVLYRARSSLEAT